MEVNNLMGDWFGLGDRLGLDNDTLVDLMVQMQLQRQIKEFNNTDAHERLKEICGQSEKLDYYDLIEKLNGITDNIEGYKFDFFVNLLAEELEHSKIVNNVWDITIDEIMQRYNDDMEYWDNAYNLYGDKDLYKDVEEFKESMLDWFLTYSLTGAFASVEYEYERRKKLGLC